MVALRININNREITAAPGSNLLQAALDNGIEIPHLCHDERIKPYGACGLCVVEVEGNKKLVRACSTIVTDGMIVKIDTARTTAARKTALRLMLSDHRGDCRPPCAQACPAKTDCQGYVGLIANGQYTEAVSLIKENLPLPASIGRICPHPCEEACRRNNVDKPVSIAALKRFVGDVDLAGDTYMPETPEPSGKKAAVVGAGPAGLSCANFLAAKGHDVVIYEAMPSPGGMLRYGIPEYRLPKAVLDEEIKLIEMMGIEIKYNVKIGRDISLEHLRKQYDAVFLGIGAWQSSGMRCKGEDMEGVIGGIDFLREVSLNKPVNLGRRVLVVGGGNTAMDVARTSVRLGAEKVSVLYRRTREEMPAEDIEITEAEEEGVEFVYLVAPVEVTGGGRAAGLRCQKMRLGEPDSSGRRKPEPIPGEEIVFEADTIIAAIGQKVTAEDIRGISLSKAGAIIINEGTFETDMAGVFAGGDAVTGPKIAIEAIGQGREAAQVIDSYLRGDIIPRLESHYVKQDDLTEEDFRDYERKPRVALRTLEPSERRNNFREVTEIMTEEEARKEASRCLECGCRDYFECQLFNYVNQYDINTEESMGEKHKRAQKEDHPFIERNSDKCILCGLCVRACDEVMGITALGLVNRGFNSEVKPEFALPLKESACISCGQCADVCPTGACMEKQAVPKQVPVELASTPSVCSCCSVGCRLTLETRGNMVYRSVPERETGEGLLCARGRFGINHINDQSRLLSPLVRVDGSLRKASWEDAFIASVKRVQAIRSAYGRDSIAIAASPRFTNEEAFLLKKVALALDTKVVGSFAAKEDVLGKMLGYDASTSSFDELYGTDVILSVGRNAESHPILGIKLKNAAAEKARLISISKEATRAQEWAEVSYNPSDGIGFFKGMIKALMDMGFVNEKDMSERTEGYEELKKYISGAAVTGEAAKAARLYGQAQKAVIVADEDTVTPDAIKLLAGMAVITGKIGNARRGIIIARSKNNSQGFIDMGIKMPGSEMIDMIEAGKVKAMVLLGEDPASLDGRVKKALDKLELLIVGDMFITESAKGANMVFPISSTAETFGTFTRTDRMIQEVVPAIEPITGATNLDILLGVADRLGLGFMDIMEIRENISSEIRGYRGVSTAFFDKGGVYWPGLEDGNGRHGLYPDGFATENKKAHLWIPEGNEAFSKRVVYDTIDRQFEEYLRANGINA